MIWLLLAGCAAEEPLYPVGPALVTLARDESAVMALDGEGAAELTADLLVGPEFGTVNPVSGPAPLSVTYTPQDGYVGFDALSFTVSRNGDTSGPFVVRLQVLASLGPTTSAAEEVALAEDTEVDLVLDATDADEPRADLVVTVSPPEHGTVVPSSGTPPLAVTYIPDADFFGADTLSFVAEDGSGNQSVVRDVLLTVVSDNDPPDAVDDEASTDATTPVNIDVLANDVDVDDVDLSVSITAAPVTGAVVVESDDTVTFTPDGAGIVTFDYRVDDLAGGSDVASVTVNVSN